VRLRERFPAAGLPGRPRAAARFLQREGHRERTLAHAGLGAFAGTDGPMIIGRPIPTRPMIESEVNWIKSGRSRKQSRGSAMEEAAKALLKSLRATAGSSFNASRRLECHDKRLTRLTAFSSAYVIILTVLPYFVKLSTEITDLYNFFTVVLSIVILTSSL